MASYSKLKLNPNMTLFTTYHLQTMVLNRADHSSRFSTGTMIACLSNINYPSCAAAFVFKSLGRINKALFMFPFYSSRLIQRGASYFEGRTYVAWEFKSWTLGMVCTGGSKMETISSSKGIKTQDKNYCQGLDEEWMNWRNQVTDVSWIF